MKPRASFLMILLVICVTTTACGQEPLLGPTITPSTTFTPVLILAPTITPFPPLTPTVTPVPNPYFVVGGQPFRFVGSPLGGWHWGYGWSEQEDDDLIQSARKMGITVFHIMLPGIEPKLGVYDESELYKLDHFLDAAFENNVYVMISFINAYAISSQWAKDYDPYYSPNGIDGLINSEKLAQAYRNRIKMLIERTNSINGKIYKDDPTIMSWIICDEPLSPEWNYAPDMAPTVTVNQLKDWINSTATYIKRLDPNHLVTIWVTGGIDTLKGGDWGDWINAVNIPSIDFIYGEDADTRILATNWPDSDKGYSAKFFNHNKPVVVQLNFGSSVWDLDKICNDYNWQAQTLDQAFRKYYDAGVSGVLLLEWGTDLYSSDLSIPRDVSCSLYTDTTNPVIDKMILGITKLYNSSSQPNFPMQFVKIQH